MIEKTIYLGRQAIKVINLTEPLRENTEVFPGDPRPLKKIVSDIESGSCQYHSYTIGDHHFHPHGDAPNHHNPEYQGRGFEFWSMDYAFNQACLIDLSDEKNIETVEGISFLTRITAECLQPHISTLKSSNAVIFRTGYDRWLEANRPHNTHYIPYLTPNASDFLSDLPELRVIGIDSLTVDKPGENYSHRQLKEKFIVEGLVHLHHIPKRTHSRFLLQTSPIAIVGATGGPVAAYAYIENF